jgi:hypothetical protein
MYSIDPGLKNFLESGVATQVGTASASGRPSAVNGWGSRVNGDGSLTVFIDTVRAATPLANLATNPKVAVVFADPISYRSVQLKGRWRAASRATEDEERWVARHREMLLSNLALIGDNSDSRANTAWDELTRIDFDVEEAFDQTPGPQAGQLL